MRMSQLRHGMCAKRKIRRENEREKSDYHIEALKAYTLFLSIDDK